MSRRHLRERTPEEAKQDLENAMRDAAWWWWVPTLWLVALVVHYGAKNWVSELAYWIAVSMGFFSAIIVLWAVVMVIGQYAEYRRLSDMNSAPPAVQPGPGAGIVTLGRARLTEPLSPLRRPLSVRARS